MPVSFFGPRPRLVIGFGEDEAGELYVLTSRGRGPKNDTGMVRKIVPAP
jgi:hypothetical protein